MRTLFFAARLLLLPILLLIANTHAAPSKEFVTIENCKFIPQDWADGDSFQVQITGKEPITVRLYGADCVELHVKTDSDKQRLRDQRRYFGITEVNGYATSSVELAIDFGKQAAQFTAEKLSNPFKIHTRMSKALGDGKFVRYYAYVELSDGKDLATELVRQGLARARGVATNGPGARTSDRYKSNLSDIELQAAKRGNGIWKFTDWNRLPLERDDQRKEEEEDQIATGEVLPNDFRLNPNTASRDNLDRLPGIGPTLADRILETREDFEFKIPSDLKQVPGIKEGIIKKFEHYLDFTKP